MTKKVLRDMLAEKAGTLDEASKQERQDRERAVQEAEESGKPLSAEEVMELRKKEELVRLAAHKKILKEKYQGK